MSRRLEGWAGIVHVGFWEEMSKSQIGIMGYEIASWLGTNWNIHREHQKPSWGQRLEIFNDDKLKHCLKAENVCINPKLGLHIV